jgi:hypothetical protein
MKTTSLPSKEQLTPEDWRKIAIASVNQALEEDRNQAYTSLVEGIKAQVKDINGEGSVFDDFATDILEKVVKPLYGKE